ncbi:hypothetical protein P3L10_024378 [Capsicum annuum]
MESEKKVESKILWRNKEEVEGQLKLEAKGDDGFNDFASSLGFVVGASFVTFLYKVIKARICIRHDSIGWSSSIHKSGCTDEVNCCVVGDLFFYEGSGHKRLPIGELVCLWSFCKIREINFWSGLLIRAFLIVKHLLVLLSFWQQRSVTYKSLPYQFFWS